MNWFLVELEIDIFGKFSEVVQAENKDDCELITLHQTSKKYNCSKEMINIVSCKKIK